jgi:hypothetical protein
MPPILKIENEQHKYNHRYAKNFPKPLPSYAQLNYRPRKETDYRYNHRPLRKELRGIPSNH